MTEVIIMAPVTLAPSPDLSSPDISQQSEIKKFVHTTIDSIEQQPSTLLSQNISGNSSLYRHILMKSLQVGLDKKDHEGDYSRGVVGSSHHAGCQHLRLIIKIFQAVPNFHKNWMPVRPTLQSPLRGQMTKKSFSVTKLIRLLLVTDGKTSQDSMRKMIKSIYSHNCCYLRYLSILSKSVNIHLPPLWSHNARHPSVTLLRHKYHKTPRLSWNYQSDKSWECWLATERGEFNTSKQIKII